MKNAEAKGEEGEVDEAQELFQQAEELQQKKAGLEAKALQASEGRTNKNVVRKSGLCLMCRTSQCLLFLGRWQAKGV